jgi:hypothetical protein
MFWAALSVTGLLMMAVLLNGPSAQANTLDGGKLPPPIPTATLTGLVSATPTLPRPVQTVAVPTPCPIEFQDVPADSTFHAYVRCLACQGIIGGYPCGGEYEPCVGPANLPYFRPGNRVTRGQIAKIVSSAAHFTDTPTAQTFQDVPTTSAFYLGVERLASRGFIGGYPCGGNPYEPCVAPENRPYFRPNNTSTRGQIAKIVASAAHLSTTPTGQTFEDVPPTSVFYVWVEQVASQGSIGGYPCGGPDQPCVAPDNRPYFRLNNPATRGQTAKIVGNAFFPNCNPPAR